MTHLILNVLIALWHSVGQLMLGIFVGAYLTRSWQRKQWILDGKRTEYRELLTVLSESVYCMLHNSPHLGIGIFTAATTGEQERKSYEADIKARSAIEDRILIAAFIRNQNVLERWQLLAAHKDVRQFINCWKELHNALIKASHKDLGIK